MARRIPLPADSVSLSASMCDALLKKGSGDAALVYLYLLRHDGFYDPEEAGRSLGWNRARLDTALLLLEELGIPTGEPKPVYTSPVPQAEAAPEYTRDDTAQAMERSSEFAALYEFVIKTYNTPSLTDRDTKTLLELYDHLGMPVEVLMVLVTHEVEEYRRKHHSTVKVPPMSYIRTAAYRWKKSGVDTLEAADSYLKRLEYHRSREGELLAAVGIVGRSAVAEESKFLSQWVDWDFPPETVRMAVEKTLFQKGQMSWSYCGGILRRWHQEGLHTPEEIRLHDAPKRPAKGGNAAHAPAPAVPITAAQQAAQDKALEENQRQLRELLKNM